MPAPPRTARRSQPALILSIQIGARSGECPADRAQLRRWVRSALLSDADLTLRFVGTTESRQLNAQFRGRDYATNVLTFNYSDEVASHSTAALQADIVICLPVLNREARSQSKAVRDHLAHLVIHGVLHAQGLDHETDEEAIRMESLETAILKRFRIADPYSAHRRSSGMLARS
jgi:probable rRNA maturation factor